jgi:hypothetical protein
VKYYKVVIKQFEGGEEPLITFAVIICLYMIKPLLLLLFYFVSFTQIIAQIGPQQNKQEHPDSLFLEENRRLLAEKILVNDIVQANTIVDSLYARGQKLGIEPFEGREEMLLLLALHRFPSLIHKNIPEPKHEGKKPVYFVNQPETILWGSLSQFVLSEHTNIHKALIKSSLPAQEKDYIKILLQFYRSKNPLDRITQDSVNTLGFAYELAYPRSDLRPTVSVLMRPTPASTKWMIGVVMVLNKKQFQGIIKQNFTDHYPFHITSEAFYKKKIYLSSFLGGGSTKTRRAFEYQEEWPPKQKISSWEMGGAVGYALFNNRKLRFIPTLGLIDYTFTYKTPEKEFHNMDLIHLTTGLHVDYKVTTSKYGADESSLILRGGFNRTIKNFSSHNPLLEGNALNIYVGIGFCSAFRLP